MLSVAIAICSLRNPEPKLICSLISCIQSDVKFSIGFQSNDAAIDRVRSLVATDFLDSSEEDVLLFIDDDILPDFQDIVNIVKEAADLKTIVCAPYMVKSVKNSRLAILPLDMNDKVIVGPKGKLMKIKYGSAGFMAIHRSVFEAVSKTLPRIQEGGRDENGKETTFYPFFIPIYPDGLYLSEDWAFCHRAGELGFDIYMDSRMVVGHVGRATFVNCHVE